MTADQPFDLSMDRSSLDVLRGSRILAYSIGAVTLVAGLVLLLWPHTTLTVVARLAGILILAVGVVDLVLTGVLGLVVVHQLPEGYRRPTINRAIVTIVFGLLILLWSGYVLSQASRAAV